MNEVVVDAVVVVEEVEGGGSGVSGSLEGSLSSDRMAVK